ncbi:hypothetical protein BP6252_08190 [Coleophoma cylindrospora]|uniref:NodB homology domain-containing protein n=1 Tax=Coleophoma cylindrospora TaxID=1849047 RepID=A0A3D8RC40_9HELO|nr:hypothetical protein BP6252_08190 [Coleophoma cylindrospora]
MRRLEKAFVRILGIRPRFMRPPYGAVNQFVGEVLSEMGYRIFNWDVLVRDAIPGDVVVSVQDGKKAYDEVLENRWSSAIILHHETKVHTAQDLIPYAVRKLGEGGYILGTIGECTGTPRDMWYEQVREPEERNESWTCEQDI